MKKLDFLTLTCDLELFFGHSISRVCECNKGAITGVSPVLPGLSNNLYFYFDSKNQGVGDDEDVCRI